jgi:2-polyprenyl-3-methyl-5-hydroxy-6-metoxy-1,4-benzoquinol methylase
MNETQDHKLKGAGKDEFNQFFQKADPWNLSGNVEQARYKLVLSYILKSFSPHQSSILELGCAEGNFTEHLSKVGYKSTSVDISDIAIERARQKKLNNTDFICSEMVEYLSANDISGFNLILLLESFYYLSDLAREILLSNLKEKCKADCKILITLPTLQNDSLFPSEDELIKLFEKHNLHLDRYLQSVPLSLKGFSNRIYYYIPSFGLKKMFVSIHKYLCRSNINQKMYVFLK